MRAKPSKCKRPRPSCRKHTHARAGRPQLATRLPLLLWTAERLCVCRVCAQGEIHNVIASLRLGGSHSFGLLQDFKALHDSLCAVSSRTVITEIDTLSYFEPFLALLQSGQTSGVVTHVALSAINKFILCLLLSTCFLSSVVLTADQRRLGRFGGAGTVSSRQRRCRPPRS
jgi:hypothetical protein